MKKSIGRTLKLMRIEKGLSQGDIEKRTGLLRSYLSRVENGHTVPSLGTLTKIAAALEVKLAELVDEPAGRAGIPPASLTDKKQLRFWNLMRRYAPTLQERQRGLLVGLARKMATGR